MNEILKAEIRKEWIAVSDFFGLPTTDLRLKETKSRGVTGTFELGERRFNLPKFREGDHVRKIMSQSLLNLV